MARRRLGALPMHRILHGREAPRGHCRECGDAVKGRRKTWCSARCVTNYKIRANPGFLRREVFRRDHGRCSICGLDTLRAELDRGAAEHEALREWWRERGVDLDDAGKPSPGRTREPGWRALLEPRARAALEPHGLGDWWWRRSLWDAHHTTQVARGGAYAGLAGVATVCARCHKNETKKERGG